MAADNKRSKSTRPKSVPHKLPDLDSILAAYLDAHAIVHTACYAINNGDDADKALASAALRQGVTALAAANDRLERAEMEISRFQPAHGQGDAS